MLRMRGGGGSQSACGISRRSLLSMQGATDHGDVRASWLCASGTPPSGVSNPADGGWGWAWAYTTAHSYAFSTSYWSACTPTRR